MEKENIKWGKMVSNKLGLRLLLIMVLFPLLLTNCIGVKTSSTFDPKATFDGYKTFGWIEGNAQNYEGPKYGFNSERMETLKGVMQEVLSAKGMVSTQDQPDFLVGFHTILEEKEVFFNKNDQMMNPYSRPIAYWDDYESYYNQELRRFLRGTLVIDIIDAQSDAVVWQSIASRYMEQQQNVTKSEMKKAVEKALKKFPPDVK
jgi:hypothetical protein